MKRKLRYLLPCIIAGLYLSGCLKSNVVNYQSPAIKGTFTGKFARFHETMSTGKLDTLLANISLRLDSTGVFAVSGDTTTVHAGSYGTWALGYGSDLIFNDATYPKTGTPVKQHLNGDYLYQYNGSTISLLKKVGDSIVYQYLLTKAAN